jgi:valyl-tRNA synthetase
MTEKLSQGYIIRILQHFATKLWNITNFVMLFQAVMICLDQDLSRSKFHSKGERSIVSILKVYYLNDKGVHDFEKRMIISKLL